MRISLVVDPGTDAALIASTGDWVPAMALLPKNRLSPQSTVCRPRRPLTRAVPTSPAPKRKASSTSALRPWSLRVASVNSLYGTDRVLLVAGEALALVRLETSAYDAAALTRMPK